MQMQAQRVLSTNGGRDGSSEIIDTADDTGWVKQICRGRRYPSWNLLRLARSVRGLNQSASYLPDRFAELGQID